MDGLQSVDPAMAPKSSRKGKALQKLPFNDDAIQKHLDKQAGESQEDGADIEESHEELTPESVVSPTECLQQEPFPSDASASGDLSRRIQGAAATLGGATGMLLAGPVSGAVLGAAALYASTREDFSGAVARKAGSLYLKVSDRACDEGVRVMDKGVEKAGAVLDKGCRRLSQSQSVPAPIRAGFQQLTGATHGSAGYSGHPTVGPEEAKRIREKHPDRIPILCERSAYSQLPQLVKNKFAVPGEMSAGEFKYLVQKELKKVTQEDGPGRPPEQTIYIFVNGVAPRCSARMAELYEQHCREDGFLWVKYSAEQTLGGMLHGYIANKS